MGTTGIITRTITLQAIPADNDTQTINEFLTGTSYVFTEAGPFGIIHKVNEPANGPGRKLVPRDNMIVRHGDALSFMGHKEFTRRYPN